MWKRFLSDYFSFTKKERTGILVLLALILFFIFIPFSYPYFIPRKIDDPTAFKNEIAALELKQADSTTKYYRQNSEEDTYTGYYDHSYKKNNERQSEAELFYFDPNTIAAAGWKRLGLRDKTIQTIENYLSKGGRFYRPEDIGKIWGLHQADIERLQPYIQIHSIGASSKTNEIKYPDKPIYKATTIDINLADTTAFIALPGIGNKLANRIVAFREKLGGFYSVAQVAETFGLPDSSFQKIKSKLIISNTTVKQVNINTASVDEMKTHPYLRYTIANALIQYRTQHGNFSSVADIKKIMTVTEEIFNKVAPYLKVD